jgi:hypothetical protein
VHNVPTTAITHETTRPSLLDGQATPCLVKRRAATTMEFTSLVHSQKQNPSLNEGHHPTQSSQAKFDFYKGVIRHSSRIG